MRARSILLVIAILVIAAFAAINWTEFVRPVPLSFGGSPTDMPLGIFMLALLGIVMFAWIISDGIHRTRSLVESRNHHRSLEAQRELAEKAEASRFTDLRTYMDGQLRDLHQRDAIAATEFQKAMVQAQRELRTQLDGMNKSMLQRLGEMESRLDARLDSRLQGRAERAVHVPVHTDPLEEQRIREERLRNEQRVEPPPQVRHPL